MDNRIKSLYITNLYETSNTLKPLSGLTITSNSSSLAYINDFSTFSKNKEITLTDPFLLSSLKINQANNAPSINQIKHGEVIKLNQKGSSVLSLQNRLTNIGYHVQQTGTFGSTTSSVVNNFQKAHGVKQTGLFGPTTLKALEEAEKNKKPLTSVSSLQIKLSPVKHSSLTGVKIASSAKTVASRMSTTGACYTGVARAIEKALGISLYGKSAYMAAAQLANNSKFKQVKVDSDDLSKLPPGAVVVWGKTSKSPHGHISVALGDGREASDHIQKQMKSLRGYSNYKVFLPSTSEHNFLA